MKSKQPIRIISAVLALGCIFFKTSAQSKTLYQTIAELDSIFFTAYNTCDLKKQAEFYSDSIEFYHDQGGLISSKQAILEGTERNICGKVTRELVKGSIEVSPIPNYGAVEIGMHMFHNNQEKGQVPHASRFVVIWQNRGDRWTIEKVISLH
jgi:ketosteroid isomerase-like protein